MSVKSTYHRFGQDDHDAHPNNHHRVGGDFLLLNLKCVGIITEITATGQSSVLTDMARDLKAAKLFLILVCHFSYNSN